MTTNYEVRSDGRLYRDGSPLAVCAVSTADWVNWLASYRSFRFSGCIAIAERRLGRNGQRFRSFYLHRNIGKDKTRSVYLGRPSKITLEKLERAAAALFRPVVRSGPLRPTSQPPPTRPTWESWTFDNMQTVMICRRGVRMYVIEMNLN